MSAESRNALAERFLAEGLRTEHHPLIRFTEGASGRRQPMLVGTRLYVHQILSTLRSTEVSPGDVAVDFGIPERLVRAAIAYYGSFRDEVDADAEHAERFAQEERKRWESEQSALA
jgi:uncharacterized protein (DUF433 family)